MTAASRAIEELVSVLADAGIAASRSAETFATRISGEASGVGVLVGLPARVGGTLSASTFEIPVYVVSADPVNTAEAVDRLYLEADAIARELRTLVYRPTTWGGRQGAEPLSAIEITVTVTVSMEEE